MYISPRFTSGATLADHLVITAHSRSSSPQLAVSQGRVVTVAQISNVPLPSRTEVRLKVPFVSMVILA